MPQRVELGQYLATMDSMAPWEEELAVSTWIYRLYTSMAIDWTINIL
jgi:hypothetical protein